MVVVENKLEVGGEELLALPRRVELVEQRLDPFLGNEGVVRRVKGEPGDSDTLRLFPWELGIVGGVDEQQRLPAREHPSGQ